MPSIARTTLEANGADLDRLWELHGQEAGTGSGRKFDVEVLNKAVVVFVCAAWEAYCEDIVAEAVQHIVADCQNPANLSKDLKTLIAKKVRDDPNHLAPWQLASNGWKQVLAANASQFINDTVGWWNTPKSEPVKKLFQKSLGIEDITANWNWQNFTVQQCTQRLDTLVGLRGEIAHRLNPANSVHKHHGTGFYELALALADKVDESVKAHLNAVTGNNYW